MSEVISANDDKQRERDTCKKVLNAGSGLTGRLLKAYNQLVKSVTGNQSQSTVNDPLTHPKNKTTNKNQRELPFSVVTQDVS